MRRCPLYGRLFDLCQYLDYPLAIYKEGRGVSAPFCSTPPLPSRAPDPRLPVPRRLVRYSRPSSHWLFPEPPTSKKPRQHRPTATSTTRRTLIWGALTPTESNTSSAHRMMATEADAARLVDAIATPATEPVSLCLPRAASSLRPPPRPRMLHIPREATLTLLLVNRL